MDGYTNGSLFEVPGEERNKDLRQLSDAIEEHAIPTSISVPSIEASSIPAVPLTREAFAPFGDVIQAWAIPNSAPKGIRVTSANQGTAFKFHKLSSTLSSYPTGEDAGPPCISVFRSTPPHDLPVGMKVFPIRILERHPFTNQAFIPMGNGTITGEEDDTLPKVGRAYLVIVALNGFGKAFPPSFLLNDVYFA